MRDDFLRSLFLERVFLIVRVFLRFWIDICVRVGDGLGFVLGRVDKDYLGFFVFERLLFRVFWCYFFILVFMLG